MVVLMLVDVAAEFKTMRQYLAMRKLGSAPYPSEVYFTTQCFSLLIYLMTVHTG